MLRKQILLLGKKVFAWSQKNVCFPDTIVSFETYVSQFSHQENNIDQVPLCCSLQMFPSNGKQTTMADGQSKEEEKGKKKSNWKKEERELLIPLYNCCGM